MTYIIPREEAVSIAVEASDAERALRAIWREATVSDHCWGPYIQEKVKHVRRCLQAIDSTLEKYTDSEANE